MKNVSGLLAGMFVAGLANAAVVTNTVSEQLKVAAAGSKLYTHNLNNTGFVRNTATSASLMLDIEIESQAYRDSCVTACDANLLPVFKVTSGGFDVFPTGTLKFGEEDGDLVLNADLGIGALTALNNTGLPTFQVTSLTSDRGAFTVQQSVLTVDGDFVETSPPPAPDSGTPPSAVSEPAAISLLSLGLLVLGVLRRSRAA